MGEHYSPEEIAEGLNGRLRTKKSKEILRHLLRGCGECLAAVQQEHPLVPLRQKRDLSQKLSSSYNASLNRAEELARRTAFLPLRERVRFRKALALLEVGNTVFALVDGDLELNGLGVYEALLVRSWDLRYESPREMCHLARAAVQVAHRLESETYGPWRVSDYSARAWGELANALRVADQLRESEEAFGKAFEFFAQGSQVRRTLMRLLDLEASLLEGVWKVSKDALRCAYGIPQRPQRHGMADHRSAAPGPQARRAPPYDRAPRGRQCHLLRSA
jgi:hypothetical protein